MTTPDVRVMVIDDHEVVRMGLVELLHTAPGLEVVAEAATVAQALQRGAAVRPDVAIVDMFLPDGTGLDVLRGLSRTTPATLVVMLSSFDDDTYIDESFRDGARAFVLANPLAVLTPSERCVLKCIGDGLSNQECAQRLHVTEKTIKNHVRSDHWPRRPGHGR